MRTLAGDSNILGDNMEALATRINNWTVADARRFLMVTLPIHNRRHISRQSFEHHMSQIHPMLIFSALMSGGPVGMGSYEVKTSSCHFVCTCVQDLLELAERLGPGTSGGLSEEGTCSNSCYCF